MNYILFFTLSVICLACSDISECIEPLGNRVTRMVQLDSFDKIRIGKGIRLTIVQANTQEVYLQSWENIIDKIEIHSANNLLDVKTQNMCNLTRAYKPSTLHIKVPNLHLIMNSSEYEVLSLDTLKFVQLVLKSENFSDKNSVAAGDFNLDISAKNLSIDANNYSIFHIRGSVNQLNIQFPSGASRFEGQNLKAQHVSIRSISANDILLSPTHSVSGLLYGTGDIILYQKPLKLDVKRSYIGDIKYAN